MLSRDNWISGDKTRAQNVMVLHKQILNTRDKNQFASTGRIGTELCIKVCTSWAF